MRSRDRAELEAELHRSEATIGQPAHRIEVEKFERSTREKAADPAANLPELDSSWGGYVVYDGLLHVGDQELERWPSMHGSTAAWLVRADRTGRAELMVRARSSDTSHNRVAVNEVDVGGLEVDEGWTRSAFEVALEGGLNSVEIKSGTRTEYDLDDFLIAEVAIRFAGQMSNIAGP